LVSAIRDGLPRGGEGGATRGQQPPQSRDAEELAACFTVHARDLFGYACVLTDADRPLADHLVQAAFEAAAAVWCTLRDLPADQHYDWLRDTLAAAIQRRTGHPADHAFVSPAHQRLTQLKVARFRADYDAVAAWTDSRAGCGPRGTARTRTEHTRMARTRTARTRTAPLLTVFTPAGYPRMGGLVVRTELAQPSRRRVTVTR
jgi:hypothetical protein